MSKIQCEVVKDLLPLYVDSLVSDTTKGLVEKHLEECSECKAYFSSLGTNIKVDLILDDKQLEDRGATLVHKIKRTQDRIKYTFIVFAMFVAVGITLLSSGIFKVIPFIIIIPFVLRLFYKESPVILLSAAGATLMIALSDQGLSYGILMLLLILPCTGAGVFAAKAVEHIFFKKE